MMNEGKVYYSACRFRILHEDRRGTGKWMQRSNGEGRCSFFTSKQYTVGSNSMGSKKHNSLQQLQQRRLNA